MDFIDASVIAAIVTGIVSFVIYKLGDRNRNLTVEVDALKKLQESYSQAIDDNAQLRRDMTQALNEQRTYFEAKLKSTKEEIARLEATITRLEQESDEALEKLSSYYEEKLASMKREYESKIARLRKQWKDFKDTAPTTHA